MNQNTLKDRSMADLELNEDNYVERISSYTLEEWKPLFDLIPEIEQTQSFGEWEYGNNSATGSVGSLHCKHSDVITRFIHIVYEIPIIIVFDWPSWEYGNELYNNIDDYIDTLDVPTMCKLTTAIVRQDRFCEGALVSAFQTGLILKLVKSIRSKIGKNCS